jgi:hypothetical protein
LNPGDGGVHLYDPSLDTFTYLGGAKSGYWNVYDRVDRVESESSHGNPTEAWCIVNNRAVNPYKIHRVRVLRPTDASALEIMGAQSFVAPSDATIYPTTKAYAAAADGWLLARLILQPTTGTDDDVLLVRADENHYGVGVRYTEGAGKIELVKVESGGTTVLDDTTLAGISDGDEVAIIYKWEGSSHDVMVCPWLGATAPSPAAVATLSATDSLNSTVEGAYLDETAGNFSRFHFNYLSEDGMTGGKVFPEVGDIIAEGDDANQYVMIMLQAPPTSGAIRVALAYVDDTNFLAVEIDSSGSRLIECVEASESTIANYAEAGVCNPFENYPTEEIVGLGFLRVGANVYGMTWKNGYDYYWGSSSSALVHTSALWPSEGTVKVLSLGGGGAVVPWIAVWPYVRSDLAALLNFT